MFHLARLSLANRTIVALAALIVIGFGVFSIPQLKQQLIPNIEFPAAFVVAPYPGASPDIVEDQVTTPIEDAVNGVEGIEDVTSTTGEGVSNISLQFAFGTDLDKASADVDEAINRIQGDLPEDVDPQVVTGSSDQIPAVVFAVTSSLDEQALADRLDEVVVPELNEIDGVRQAEVTGVREQQVTVKLDEEALRKKGLAATSVSEALTANGTPVPAGSVDEDTESISVQVAEKFDSAEDIENIYLTPPAEQGQPPRGGAAPKPVKLGDVATVTMTEAKTTTITRTNGKPSLGLLVTAAPDGNNVLISDEIRDRLPDLTDRLGNDTELTVVFDQAPYVKDSIKSLGTEGLLGLIFAVIVILLFLLSLRSTIVTAVSIPMSVLIALIAMWTGDLSLNLLTLGGLTVAVGRVVDDSIVVLENIKRHLAYGEEKQQAVLNGVREVATAITASTLTTVAVFVPIAFISGIVGELFRPFAITVTIALLASLFVALTVIPVLCYWFLGAPKRGDEDPAVFEQRAIEKERRSPLQRIYVPVIRFSTKHRFVTVVLALLILAGTGALGTRLQTNFLDASGQNAVTITQEMPTGTNLETTSEAVAKVEDVLADEDAVDSYQVTIGGDPFGGVSTTGAARATYQLTVDEGSDVIAVQDRIRDGVNDISEIGTVAVNAGQGGGGFAASSQLQVVVQSTDADSLEDGAEQVRKAVAGTDDVTDVSSDLTENAPRIQVATKRSEAARHGLTDGAIGQAVASALQGSTVTQMTIDSQQHDVVLTTDDPPESLADIKALPLQTPLGEVRLDDVATVTQGAGPATISHVDGSRSATITATPGAENTGAVTAELTQKLNDLDLPAGVSYNLGGVSQDQSDAFTSLGLALVAAIVIVFLIMAATFRSLAQPLILMVSVPFAATGAIGLLLATGTSLGVPALIGVLMLVGIVVTNAIVLVDLMNRYRVAGMGVSEAVIEGGRRRLRPVVMTAVATICALTPMALGVTENDGGGFISQSLAIVVIGGLVSSTLLTLVVVPTLYTSLELGKERRAAKRAARRERKAVRKGGQPTPAPAPVAEPEPAAETAATPVAPVVAAVPAADGSRVNGHVAAPPWTHDRVGAALAGDNPTVLTRLEGGFAAIGDVQFLPGYSVLLTDDPDATRLTDLPRTRRLQFLADVERLAEAVERVCARRDPAFRRINIEIQGNEDGFLHAHVWPRYEWEPGDVSNRPVGRYGDDRWQDPSTRLGPQHDELRAEILAELDQLVFDPARTPQGGRRRREAGPSADGQPDSSVDEQPAPEGDHAPGSGPERN
ncbi:MAG: MMPL family transporter [Streptosporangiales bacterium]|nr:MMPL family transporter [Streptosporangiales bacterium]